ncbi:hypothetical protein [Streptomyces sp. NBC_01306]|uniref:hypothetical protein n=1 Tax=Streptomyces sp. NBC_01306 TaxID=2903819 RepID=UPI00225B61F0|nr:hypothetical protein [Streptomyces sp. NBC_01306]MCX4724596.1 hypothetical protein [Streptomyces sp. NBC_01306]
MDAVLEYRPLMAVDIERSGGRGDVALLRIREVLLNTLQEALKESGIDWQDCRINDLGDGLRIVAPAWAPKSRLIHPLFHELVVRLHAHNRTAAGPTRIRLRVALHAGDVWLGRAGVAGGPLEVLARLLDARPAREALAGAPLTVPASLLVSQHFYDETVRHGYPGIDPESFRRVDVTEKEYSANAWLHLPGAAAPTGGAAAPDQAVEPHRRDRPAGQSKMINKASGHGVVYATQNGNQNINGRPPE